MKIIYIDYIYFEIVIVKENCKFHTVSRETKHNVQFRIVVNSVIPLLSYFLRRQRQAYVLHCVFVLLWRYYENTMDFDYRRILYCRLA